MEHFQINKTYGNVLTTTIERDSVLHNLNKTKTNLNVGQLNFKIEFRVLISKLKKKTQKSLR